ncbi:uncharacterized protein LOC120440778 isoform X2 [Oreochromis aureus]|uniref:uncharacterized protein LOC120440778 isoform X2 n=1 Tax=Oreochromis aureus TaxID=47969 RepID=UPI001954AEF7|nr:uncharacterized protein LOC120440778 isoform X2 [Oreochromis aureus]
MTPDGRSFLVKTLARFTASLNDPALVTAGRVNVLASLMDTLARIIALCFLGVSSSAVTKEINVRSSTTTSPNFHSTTTTLKPDDPDKLLDALLPVGIIFLLIVVGFCLKKRVTIRQCVGELKGQKRGVDRSIHVELQSLENSTLKDDKNKAS